MSVLLLAGCSSEGSSSGSAAVDGGSGGSAGSSAAGGSGGSGEAGAPAGGSGGSGHATGGTGAVGGAPAGGAGSGAAAGAGAVSSVGGAGVGGSATSAGGSAGTAGSAGAAGAAGAPRLVLAGDSWSTGLISPLRDSLDAHGFTTSELSYEHTANAGSQAQGWVANKHPPAAGGGEDTTKPRMLDALNASLDASPEAAMLVLVIGGNDLNREADAGLGELPDAFQKLRFDAIEADIQQLVDVARAARPQLKVVLIGYDYLHYEFLVAFGLKLDGFDTKSYNEAFVELGTRKRAIAARTPNVEYAHNYGVLQHTYGDTVHPPFSIPNPLTGHPEYAPLVAPAPGHPPAYDPFPGGFITYPAPLDYMPDGIHPNPAGFRTIIDHSMTQGMANWLAGSAFTP